jgi:hypothetical protein
VGVIEEYPELARLALLPTAGWAFRPVEDEGGKLSCVAGWRNWGGTRDTLWIFDRGDCLVMRTVDSRITWERTGSLDDCLSELAELPEPSRLLAPWPTKATLWTP